MPPQTFPVVPVFVSSTRLDLEREREAVRDAVLRMKQTQFVGMEYFGSRDETARGASLEEVERSLVYVGIFGGRYGSGITEDEYRRARERGLSCFIYFKADSAGDAGAGAEENEQDARLEALKGELMREHVVCTFKNPDDLAARVTADLHRWLFDEYLPKLPASPAQTLHQLRAPVGDFVGRESEIEQLLSALRGGGAGAAVAGVSGMGGVGKTELSLYAADRLRDAYPDAQLVLDMRGTDERPREPSNALAACIRAFHGLETPLPDDTEELTRLYRSTLEGRRALILLDNAFDGAQVRPLLPPAGSALLVTSRGPVTLPGMKARVALDQLSPEEARELLTGIAPRVEANAAERVCELCGYLPLALRAAGSLLAVTVDLEPTDYVAQLRDERTRLEQIGAEGVDVSVEASFNLSYARLAPEAARVFRRLSVFPASFDAAAEEVVCEDERHERLTELLRHNLVAYNPDTRRYSLNNLARLFADSRLSDAERVVGRVRHSWHYLNVLGECGKVYKQGGDFIKESLARFDKEWRNIKAGQEWASTQAGADERATRFCCQYPNAGASLIKLRLHPRERVRWLEAALDSARRLGRRNFEGVHSSSLGHAYGDLGETRRAIELYRQYLLISRELGDRGAEGDALKSIAASYGALGQTRGIAGLYKKSLDIARELGDRHGEAIALHALGGVYHHVGFEHAGLQRLAAEYYEYALAILRELGDRHGEAKALDALGSVYVSQRNLDRAVEVHEQSLAIARELGDRLGEQSALGSLARDYFNLGDPNRAVEIYRQALTLARELGARPAEAVELLNMAIAFNKLGEREQAIAHAEAAREIFEQIESPEAATAREALRRWRGDATKEE